MLGPEAPGLVEVVGVDLESQQIPADLPSLGRALYSIDERVLYLPVIRASGPSVYRFDIPTRQGRWQQTVPGASTSRRLLFAGDALLGSSRVLRDRTRPTEPVRQPFGGAALRVSQEEQTYSRTWYNVGFPFGQTGWRTEQYGVGRLELRLSDATTRETLLLSQAYRANNLPFTAGWSPNGRYVVVVESLESASYYRGRTAPEAALRFAVFGPFPVEKTQPEILRALAHGDEQRRQRLLDRGLRQGRITPAERYGAFYDELVENLRSCAALVAVTGPIEMLALKPSRTLDLSDGRGESDGLYFTFEVRTTNGDGELQTAAFYPATPQAVRERILSQIIRHDLAFEGERYFLDGCGT